MYTATVTVGDDDGGTATKSFKDGVIVIQVVSQINLKSGGVTPVKIFVGPGFSTDSIVASSLRFGPAAAQMASVSDNGKLAMTHVRPKPPASGRPTPRHTSPARSATARASSGWTLSASCPAASKATTA